MRRWFLLLMLFCLSTAVVFSQTTATAENDFQLYLPLISSADTIQATDPVPFGPTFSGEGTYYFNNSGGIETCMFDFEWGPRFIAAVNNSQFNAFQMNGQTYPPATLCGAYAEVTGPAGTVIVRLVNRCPECAYGDLDLSPDAFDQIAERIQGRVPITWRLLSVPVSEPLIFRYKEGSSRYWTAVQVRKLPHPVVQMEVLQNGEYLPMTRQFYNYFTRSGVSPGRPTFRVTDIFGNQVIVTSEIPLPETDFPDVVDWISDQRFPHQR